MTAPAGTIDAPARRRCVAGARDITALAARVAVIVLAAVAAVAVGVRLTVAARARAWLNFPFPGVPATVGEAARIFAHNAEAMLLVFGLLLIAQLAARRTHGPACVQRLLMAAGELVLTGAIAANVIVVGAALGAYGTRMARAVMPHGPVELAAFSLVIGLYLQGRRRTLAPGHVAATSAVAVGLLALAALLEALVNP